MLGERKFPVLFAVEMNDRDLQLNNFVVVVDDDGELYVNNEKQLVVVANYDDYDEIFSDARR